MKFLLLVHFTGLTLLGTTVLCEEKSDVIPKEPIKQLAELEEAAPGPLKYEQEAVEVDEDELQEPIEHVYEPRLFHVVDVPDDENVNLGQILEDFFGGDEADEQEASFNREGRAKKIKNEVLVFNNDSAVIAQYNGFIDAFLRQLSTTMKENSDPLTIILRKNFKITGAPKGQNKRKGPGALNVEDEDSLDDGPKRPKRPKGGKNRNRRKQKNRHPKNLSFDDAEEEEETEGKTLQRERREVEGEIAAEKSTDSNTDTIDEAEETAESDKPDDDADLREGRVFEDEYEDMEEEEEEELEENGALVEADEKSLTEVNGKALSTSDAEVDEGRSDGNEIESRNRRNKRRRKGGRKGKRRKGKCAKKCQRRRRRRMRIRRRNRNNKNRGKRSAGSAAILSGLSLIKREGDVQIVQRENTQDIHANVEVGPVTLTAEKSFGEGDKQEQRKSEAVAQAVKGKLVINISKDGNATVNAFKIFRPKDVSVSGSLRLDQSKTPDRLMQTYLTQASPFVSKRMKAAANKVFGIEQPTKPKKNKNKTNRPGKNKGNKNRPKN